MVAVVLGVMTPVVVVNLEEDPEVEAAIAAAEKDLEGEGRVLIRPSGTEPLVRVMLEGQDVEKITEIAEKIAVLLTKKFG